MATEESTAVVPAAPTAVAVPANKPVVSDTTKLVTRMIDTVYSDGIFPSTVTPEQKTSHPYSIRCYGVDQNRSIIMANATDVVLNALKDAPFGISKVMVKNTWGWTDGTKFPKLENVSGVFTLGKDVGVTAALTKDYSTIVGRHALEDHIYLYVSIKEAIGEDGPGVELDVDFISFDKSDMPFDERFKVLTDISAKKGDDRCGILCFVTGKKSPISVDVPVFNRDAFDEDFGEDDDKFINDVRSKSIILALIEMPIDKVKIRRQDIPICE